MLGRQAYQEPYLLALLDAELFGTRRPLPPREDVALAYADYVDRRAREGHRLPLMLRHIQGLYAGLPNARSWRRYLTEEAHRAGAVGDVLRDSLRMVRHAA
jgi:tRNA-dihydrouridine synthase A